MNKKIVVIVVCIILVVITCCAVFISTRKNNTDNENTVNNTTDQNNVLENYIKDENVVDDDRIEEDNKQPENEPIQTEPNTGTSVVPSSAIYETNSDIGTTDKKQEAINLVKNYWGEDSDATYRCDYVDSNGEYIIAISSLQSASVKGYFRVNLENKTVDIEY